MVNNIESYLILAIALSFRDLKRIIEFLLYFNNNPQRPHLNCILVKRGTVVMTFVPWCLGFVPHSAYQILNKRYLKVSFGRRLHFQDEGKNNNNKNKNNNNNNNNF